MFYHHNNLQCKTRVDKPNPSFAKLLQQAISEIDLCQVINPARMEANNLNHLR